MKSFSNYLFLILLSMGLAIRLFLALVPGQVFDVKYWFDWSLRLHQDGLSQFYTPFTRTDYMPGYLYILYGLGFIQTTFHTNDILFFYILKMPGIFTEIMLAVIVYFTLIKITKPKLAIIGLSAILFNPVFIFNSAVWGQIDGLLSLSLLVTINYLKNKSFIFASTALAIAFLIKPQTIAILPIFILYIIKNLNAQNLIKSTLPFFLVIFIASFPFFPHQPLAGLVNLIIKTASEYPYTSLNAYNFWGVVGFWISDNQLWNGISYQTLGYILLAGYWILIGYFYLKRKSSLYALAALATLGFFFLPTRVHERYLYPAIVFLILIIAMYKSRFLLMLTGVLSLLHFLNLYYVYVYYNELYLRLPKMLYNPTLYNFLDANSKNLSLLSTFIFVLITIGIIRSHAAFKEN